MCVRVVVVRMWCLAMVCLLASTLAPAPLQARSIDRIEQESGSTYRQMDHDYVRAVNVLRRANGLDPVRLRAQSTRWSRFNRCLSNLNVQRHNTGRAMGHLAGSRACESFPELHTTAEVWGAWGGTATDAVAARIAVLWYRSEDHRRILLSNADWVQVHMVSYQTEGGAVWHMGQLQFGTDNPDREPFRASSRSLGRANPVAAMSDDDPAHPLFAGRFNGLGWKGELVSPTAASRSRTANGGWTDPIVSSLEPGVSRTAPDDYYRYRTARLYVAYFGRRPDGDGWGYWNRMQILRRLDLVAVSDAFARSQEFRRRYGTVDDSRFVTLVYRNVMGRNPDPPGRRYWTDLLARGTITRGELMVEFAQSSEFTRKAAPRLTGRHWNGRVAESYRRALPSTVGLGF